MDSEEGKDIPPEELAVKGEALSAVSAMGEAPDRAREPVGAGKESLDPMTRKRKSRQAKKKQNRDESKPSHPLSAYNFFFRDERVRFLQEPKKELEPGENRFTSMGKEIARRWKSLQSDHAQKYHKMAANDLARYRKELEEYQSKKGSTHKKVLGDERKTAPSSLKPAPLRQSEREGMHGSVSAYRESNPRFGASLPPPYDSISSSGINSSSEALGHRDLATEAALAQLFAQDASAASVRRFVFENGGRSVPDHSTLGLQLLSQNPLLASALTRPGLDRDYSSPLGGSDPTAILRDLPLQGTSFTEQLLMSNLMGRSGAESFNTGAMPWNSGLFNLPSVSTDPTMPQQRALEQYELLQLLSGSASQSTSSLRDQSSNPVGLPSQSLLSAGPQSSSERSFLGSSDALALQRLLLLRHQQERDMQAAMAVRSASDDIMVRRLLGAVRESIDGRPLAEPGQLSRDLDRNDGDSEASGGS